MGTEYTVGDLLSSSQLNLELLTGSSDALNVPLRGAHSIEINDPSLWLEPGWLMLTMGTRLRQRPSEQRQLIADLQQLGAAALGFGVGVAFKTVPPAMLEEATARNFPVILVPAETQFQEISRTVFHSAVSSEARTYARLTALHHNLMHAFSDPQPLESTLNRLARLSNSVAAVVDTNGTVHGATSSLPFAQIVESLRSGGSFRDPAVTGEWEIIAAPLPTWGGRGQACLVLANRTPVASHKFMRAMLDGAVPIFQALGGLTAADRRKDQALSRAMLDSALTHRLSDIEASQFEDHLVACDMPVHEGLKSAVVTATDQSLLEELEQDLLSGSAGTPLIFSRRDGDLVIVMSSSDGSVATPGTLFARDRNDEVRMSIGRAVTTVRDLAISHRDAMVVLRSSSQTSCGTARFDDLDLAAQLLTEVAPERVASKAQAIVDLLVNNPIQLDALRAYFTTHQDVQAAAKSIFVHPNTLRYRLERFELALGRSLREPAVIVSLYYVLALMEGRYSGRQETDAVTALGNTGTA